MNRILVTSLPAKGSVIDVGELCAGRGESWREIELVRIFRVDGWVGLEEWMGEATASLHDW